MRIIDLDQFDTERVLAEQALVAGERDDDGEDLQVQHPVSRYRSGKTRFDLGAVGQVYAEDEDGDLAAVDCTAREYLKNADPPIFEARRLSMSELAACEDQGEAVGAVTALHMACKTITGVEGLVFSVGRRKLATEGQVDAAKDALGYDVMLRVGRMILAGSRAPTSAEKKPSGSSRGAS